MYKRSEGFFKGYQDVKIFFQSWEKKENSASIIILHGQGEHSECYHRLVDYFANDNWNFYAMDLRGHGRSEGKRGYVAHFNDYSRDYEIFIKHLFASRIKRGPVILLAHSMGGMIQLKFLAESYSASQYPLITAQVCSGPLLGFSLPVPQFKDVGAEIMAKFFPTMTLWNEIKNKMLTRDQNVIKEYESDVLRHDVLSSKVYLGMKENFYFLFDRASRITLPTLFQIAEQDPVVSSPAAKDFFEKLGSTKKRILVYGDDAKHEIYNDIIRDQAFQDLKKYLDSILNHKDQTQTTEDR